MEPVAMAEPPVLTIRRNWTRPGADMLERWRGTPSGFAVDALGRAGALSHDIKPVCEVGPFVGSALTVWTTPRDNLAPYAALTLARPGDVMLIATGGAEGFSVIGDLIIGMMRNCGVVAVVTDGLVRDVPGIRDVGIPCYARGVSPNSPFKNGPGGIGVPITIGGGVVESGDIVVGDGDGIVVVPQRRIDEALAELAEVRKKEAAMDAAVRGGMRVPDWVQQALDSRPVKWLD
jgi:4-hydroxy-4-methyl-2-oxoglutarate aldolase